MNSFVLTRLTLWPRTASTHPMDANPIERKSSDTCSLTHGLSVVSRLAGASRQWKQHRIKSLAINLSQTIFGVQKNLWHGQTHRNELYRMDKAHRWMCSDAWITVPPSSCQRKLPRNGLMMICVMLIYSIPYNYIVYYIARTLYDHVHTTHTPHHFALRPFTNN